MAIQCFAALEQGRNVQPWQYEAKAVGVFDIAVKITYCGICHSDLHLIKNEWGISSYPLVPGHEIIGTVSQLGAQVKHLEKGQRVGIGWQRSACLQCDLCLGGHDNLCPKNEATCVGNYGGFAQEIVSDSRFAFAIPESISSVVAAPLLCAGVTVYSPLRSFNVRPAMKLGVIGIGGLGHLALQFSRAYGCEVTAFSSSADKEAEAKKFGAQYFVNTSDANAVKDAVGSLDFILSTVSADIDWPVYLGILKPGGSLCVLGVPAHEISVPAFALIGGRKTLCGSPIGSRSTMSEMLTFAARHGIKPQVDVMAMDDVNAALEKLEQNKARYRIVLKN
jgi:alcohol/geraniol dehydrogenase (NADP+)